jgi:hypothetical protein
VRNITFDAERTKSRLLTLEEYARQVRIEPLKFACASLPLCSASLAGDIQLELENCGGLAHIGENYDVVLDGQELRILFVGKDYGCGNSDLKTRRGIIQTYADPLNPHYKGIIKVLMEVFQDRCEGGTWRTLLRRMAQTNATRCTAPRPSKAQASSMQSNITKTMRMNCWSHLKKEIEVLEPTLIWFHDAVAKSSFLEAVRKEGLFPTVPYERYQQWYQVEWTIFRRPFKSVLAFFHHPAYGHFGRQWELATDVIARLREEGCLPVFAENWSPLKRKEWPVI